MDESKDADSADSSKEVGSTDASKDVNSADTCSTAGSKDSDKGLQDGSDVSKPSPSKAAVPCRSCAINVAELDSWDAKNRFRALHKEFGHFTSAVHIATSLGWKISSVLGRNIL